MITIITIIVIILIIIVLLERKEGYSAGALTQLMAKGPQDTYLTGDAWKYIPWWYYNYPYPYMMSTRGGYYTMPYYGVVGY